MRVVIAPQAFKGSLGATEVAEAIARGLGSVWPDVDAICKPVADGGEGTVRALVASTGGALRTACVQDPLGRPVEAVWGFLGDGVTAVVEVAAASGLPRLRPEERDPRRASTFGTGELIRAALDAGAERLLVGLGGSATNDGGAGLAQALGVHLIDDSGAELPPGGAALARLARIDLSGLDRRAATVPVQVLTDVTNPLCGPQGTSALYGPQKGATPETVAELDAALAQFARVIERELGKRVIDLPGAGAAGGVGAGLVAFLDAELWPGAPLVLEAVGLAVAIDGADLVVTGEGRLDVQSLFGKATIAVAQLARAAGVPALAIVGGTEEDCLAYYAEGLAAVQSIPIGPMPLAESEARAAELIEEAARRAARLIDVGRALATGD
jgi:glycerate kinase